MGEELTRHTYIIALDYEEHKDMCASEIAKILVRHYGILSFCLKQTKSKGNKWIVYQFSVDLYDDEVF